MFMALEKRDGWLIPGGVQFVESEIDINRVSMDF